MNIQRLLKLFTCILLAATIIVVLLVPEEMVQVAYKEMLVKWTIMSCLVLFVIALDQKGQKGRFLCVLQYGAVFLILFGALGTYTATNGAEIEAPLHETVALDACGLEGYSVCATEIDGKAIEQAKFEVVYTRADHIHFHETISQAKPLDIENVEIHPVHMTDKSVTFFVQENVWRYVVLAGGILFTLSLVLSIFQLFLKAFLRKRGKGKC